MKFCATSTRKDLLVKVAFSCSFRLKGRSTWVNSIRSLTVKVVTRMSSMQVMPTTIMAICSGKKEGSAPLLGRNMSGMRKPSNTPSMPNREEEICSLLRSLSDSVISGSKAEYTSMIMV